VVKEITPRAADKDRIKPNEVSLLHLTNVRFMKRENEKKLG